MGDYQWFESYRQLCDLMRSYPVELAKRLENAPPIGLHLFVPNSPGGREVRWSEAAWAKFKALNDGLAGTTISGWEKWGRFPDGTGCFRFFGQGKPEDLRTIKETLTLADQALSKYEELPVPQGLKWKLPDAVRASSGHLLPDYYCMLELVCRTEGCDSDGIEVLGAEKRIRQKSDPEKSDKHETVLTVVRTFCISDFVACFKKAIEKWIPRGLEFTHLEILDELRRLKPTAMHEAKMAEDGDKDALRRLIRRPSRKEVAAVLGDPDNDYFFVFNSRKRLWHVRYRWGNSDDGFDDEWLPDTRQVQYVAYMLERPSRWVPCEDIFPLSDPENDSLPSLDPKIGRPAVGREEIFTYENDGHQQACLFGVDGESNTRFRVPPSYANLDKQHRQAYWDVLNGLQQEIKDARSQSDGVEERRLLARYEHLLKEYRSQYDKYGRPRPDRTSRNYRAANRVRNGIDHCKAMLAPDGRYPMPHFHQHLLDRLSVIFDSCFYLSPPETEWAIRWPLHKEHEQH